MHKQKEVTKKFDIIFLEDAVGFLDELEEKARDKVIYNIRKAQVINDNELFKKLVDDIWEFRTLYKRAYYRVFAFWDKKDNTETLVVATHGIIKKTGKTPPSEIEKAKRIRDWYFKNKE